MATDRDTSDADELAFLAGGRSRAIEAAVARRLAAGTLRIEGRGFVGSDGTAVRWSALQGELDGGARAAEHALRRAGLLVPTDALTMLRAAAAGPFVALAAFGAIKLLVGITRERPVEFLAALLVLTLIVAAIRWSTVDQRTSVGRAALDRAQARYDRLRLAPTRPEMALGVALFGTAVLASSEFAPFHAQRRDSDGGGDGGASGDGGDGGGGCGGGCGGCGD